jgi:hypothetical protein
MKKLRWINRWLTSGLMLVATGLFLLVGCSGGGSGGSSAPAVTAPSGLAYSPGTLVLTKGTAMAAVTPTCAGSAPIAYGVNPALPAGLTLDGATGTLSGTPTALAAQAGYTVTASNSAGSTTATLTITVHDAAPAGLAYASPTLNLTVGTAMTADTPSSSGGAVTSYSVDPALPGGLALDSGTGIVTGTPTTVAAQATYTVTAANAYGQTTAGLVITVNGVAPNGLSYSSNPATYTVGSAITANTPAVTAGTPASYSVAPALPAGLSMSATTGVITGTPTAAAAQATYTVTASNAYGKTTASLVITVKGVAPSGLTYATNPATYPVGSAITANAPTLAAGTAPISYSVNPALPAGLSMSASTGIITGTPTAVTIQATYVVTATNPYGQTTVNLVLAVANAAPANLAYATNPATYPVGTAITPDAPTTTGGAPTSYSVSPALPAGLSLNTSTGVITGTPTAVTAQASYTVTATNAVGHATASLVVTVPDAAPANLAYASNPATYPVGSAITANDPTTTGGTPTSYGVSPALPAGLSLNTSTGVITGAPTAVTAQATYTVTATNAVGHATANLVLTVANAAPSNLTYATNPAQYTTGVAIASNSPSYAGGTPTSYSVSPALPAGLALNTTSGVITGTPSAVAVQASYTVTATNSVGHTTASLAITVYAAPMAEVAAPLSVHPGDAWMTASVPDQDALGDTYAWTGSLASSLASTTSKSSSFTAPATTGGYTLDADVQNPASIHADNSRTVTVQTGTWLVEDGSLGEPYGASSCTVLPSGRVLLAGGIGPDGRPDYTCWIYDPVSGHWNQTGAMATGRAYHAAALLADGTVLVCGGQAPDFSILASAEIYDPATGAWTPTGALGTARQGHTATRLASGKVLAAGGGNGAAVLATAEIFDPAAGTWSAAGSLSAARESHTATLLGNGMVLVAGGENASATPLANADLYDPAGNAWTATSPLNNARYGATATLLNTGLVLVAGGEGLVGGSTATTELFDPGAGTWTASTSLATGNLNTPRTYHTATLLTDGTVLVAGGHETNSIADAEIYTPTTGTWAYTAASGFPTTMAFARTQHVAALLPNGNVLVAGGFDDDALLVDGTRSSIWGQAPVSAARSSTEIYSFATGAWSSAPVQQARQYHTASLLGNGTILVAGGMDATGTPLATVQIYNPSSRTWSSAAPLNHPRAYHTATVLSSTASDTQVLVAGGVTGSSGTLTGTAEIYDSQTNTWLSAGTLATARKWHTATLDATGAKVLIAGGSDGSSSLASTEVYTISGGAWASGPNLTAARQNHTATLLKDGTVLIAGGLSVAGASTLLSSAERVASDFTASTATTSMSTARQRHTATLMPDGSVVVTCGADATGTTALAGSELFVPGTGWLTVSTTDPLARLLHTANLIAADSNHEFGQVLVVGGYDGGPVPDGWIYTGSHDTSGNPIAGTWVAAEGSINPAEGGFAAKRFAHTVTDLSGTGNGPFVACFGDGADLVTEVYQPVP